VSIPTHEDAKLMVELFKLRLDPYLQESENWFTTQFEPGSWEELKTRYPVSSREWRMLNTVLGYWEMLGALIDQNLLSEDLLFDAMEGMEITWAKVKEWLPSARSEVGPDLWENIEVLATRQQKWRSARLPKSQRA
jgi:hypothetical protein